jgi:hypothetical protein
LQEREIQTSCMLAMLAQGTSEEEEEEEEEAM